MPEAFIVDVDGDGKISHEFSVPPVIVETLTSNDMVVREGTNVTLTCKAKGFPEPYVMWRREDGDEMSISGENGENYHLKSFHDERLIRNCNVNLSGKFLSIILHKKLRLGSAHK